MEAVLALSKGQKGASVVVQEEVEALRVVFSLTPLPCFLLFVVVALIGSCFDGVLFLVGHLW